MSNDLASSDPTLRPKASYQDFLLAVENAITDFLPHNFVIEKIEKNSFTIQDYHSLLNTIFHQVYYSSTSFAMAGAMLSETSVAARSYLIHHAEEEKDHWQWIINDLNNTGFKGTDPRYTFPNWAAQAYLSYGVYLSTFNPLGRLAMANVLEGISGRYGLKIGGKVLMQLKLKKEQGTFFLAHGELDQGHSADISKVLQQENLNDNKWAEMCHVAKTTGCLYKNLYNSSVENIK